MGAEARAPQPEPVICSP